MLKYVFLGVVQGLSEFFPVSSSGHLALLQKIIGMGKDTVALAVVLHFGTALAVVIFFFHDILAAIRSPKVFFSIVVVTVITGGIGLAGKSLFEGLFTSPQAIAIAWLITAGLLLATKKFSQGRKKAVGIKEALVLGAAQGLSIAPGISRSGMTISALLFCGLERQPAFSFSFIAALPAIFGAGLLEARKIDFALRENFSGFLVGFIASFLSGLFALWMLKKIMYRAKLYYFAFYCMLIAFLTLLLVR
jgi:undecaprenyl-diphosphatase